MKIYAWLVMILQDSFENLNLAKLHPEKVKALIAKLSAWSATLPERP